MYSDNNIKTYKGMRVLGIDGSKIIFPPLQTLLMSSEKFPMEVKKHLLKVTTLMPLLLQCMMF